MLCDGCGKQKSDQGRGKDMKQGRIWIAAALLCAAGVAKAGGIAVNFDGAAMKTAEVKGQSFGAERGSLFAQVSDQAQPEIAMPGRPVPEFTRDQVSNMDRSIQSAIDYVRLHQQGETLAAGFDCLLREGTPEQKFAFVYHSGTSAYAFPDNCVMRNKGAFTEGCKWVFDTVCKTVTYMACAIMADGSKECHEEAREDCKVVKQCLFSE
jgi:hypothetical protein